MARSRSSDVSDSSPSGSTSPRHGRNDMAPTQPVNAPKGDDEVNVAIAASPESGGGTITARKAGGLRDVGMVVDPREIGIMAALQHLAKGVNVAFQTDYGENFLEAVYQAAIVYDDEIRVVHKEYFGFGQSWFSQFGKLIRSMQLTLDGPDPASPEGQRRIREHGPASIRGMLNLFGRKLDLATEYEDRVPAYVEQMFDRLEASGIIAGWNRGDWRIRTTRIGLDIRITPSDTVLGEIAERRKVEAEAKRAEAEAKRAEAEAKRAEAEAKRAEARAAAAQSKTAESPPKRRPSGKKKRS